MVAGWIGKYVDVRETLYSSFHNYKGNPKKRRNNVLDYFIDKSYYKVSRLHVFGKVSYSSLL